MISPDILHTVLRRADSDDMLFRWEDVADWPEGTVASLVEIGILRLASPASTLDCVKCEWLCHSLPVEQRETAIGEVSYYLPCPRYVTVSVEPSHRKQWQLNVDTVCEAVSRDIAGNRSPDERISRHLWYFGQPMLGSKPVHVFLVRGVVRPDTFETTRGIVLILTFNASIAPLDPQHPAIVVALDSVLRVRNNSLTLDYDGLVARLAGEGGGASVQTEEPHVDGDSAISIDTVFQYFDDFRTVVLHGREFKLTRNQSRVIERLYVAAKSSKPCVSRASLLKEIGEASDPYIGDAFKRNPDIRRALVASCIKKGFYRLNVPLSETPK